MKRWRLATSLSRWSWEWKPDTEKWVSKSRKMANKADGVKQTKLTFSAVSTNITSAAKFDDDSELDEFILSSLFKTHPDKNLRRKYEFN